MTPVFRRSTYQACATLLLTCAASPIAAQQVTVDGVVDRIWGDDHAVRSTRSYYFLVTPQGARYRLSLPAAVPAGFGDPGRTWTVAGFTAPAATDGSTEPRLNVTSVSALAAASVVEPLRSRRYVTLRCDVPNASASNPPNSFSELEALNASTFPGVGEWMRQMSHGVFTYQHAGVLGAYALPGSVADYFPTGNTGLDGPPNFSALFGRCTAAASGDLDWSSIDGVLLVHNGNDGRKAYGGTVTATVGGTTRTFGVTWLRWSLIGEFTHAVGHSLGWSHSGPVGNEYGSPWDVMSDPRTDSEGVGPNTTVGTIGYIRALLGWIGDNRRTVLPLGQELRTTLTFSSFFGIPTPGSLDYVEAALRGGERMTVEARQQSGPYDVLVPHSGVVLHEFMGMPRFRAALAPRDSALVAVRPGPLYDDPLRGFRVEVLGASADGFDTRITNGWRVTAAVVGGGTVSGLGAPCTDTCTLIATSPGQQVVLTPQPGAGPAFIGWAGACTGTGACSITTNATATSVTAVFGDVQILANPTRPYAYSGRPYTDELQAFGATGTSWALVAGALPPGLSLHTTTGTVGGTATTPGIYQYTVRVTSGAAQVSRVFSTEVRRPLTITVTSLYAIVDEPFDRPVSTHGGEGASVWWEARSLLAGGLGGPDDLTLGRDGRITGTPRHIRDSTLTIRAHWDTTVVEAVVRIRVIGRPIIASPATLPAAILGDRYRYDLQSGGPPDEVEWALLSGALPAGITLSVRGVLEGEPTVASTQSFTVVARFDTLATQRTLSLSVRPPAISASRLLDALLRNGALAPSLNNYLDAIGNRNGRFDVGDVRAWLIEQGVITPGATAVDAVRALTALSERVQ